MYLLDLFSGIGGFHLAAQMAGFEFKKSYFSEINEFSSNIYKKSFPASIALGDVTRIKWKRLPGGDWLLCAGFPCQPFSIAGKQGGSSDERYMWGEIVTATKFLKPTWIVCENVPQIENVPFSVSKFEVGSLESEKGIDSISEPQLYRCCQDLENEGYEVAVFEIPAIAKNAPHRRMRTWIIANRESVGYRGRSGQSNGNSQREFSPNKPKRRELRSEIASLNFTHFNSDKTSAVNEIPTRRAVNSSISRNASKITSNAEYNARTTLQRQRDESAKHAEFANDNLDITDSDCKGMERYGREYGLRKDKGEISSFGRNWHEWFEVATELCGMDDGLSSGLDFARLRNDIKRRYPVATEEDIEKCLGKLVTKYRRERIEAMGNAIVPQVAFEIFKAIKQADKR